MKKIRGLLLLSIGLALTACLAQAISKTELIINGNVADWAVYQQQKLNFQLSYPDQLLIVETKASGVRLTHALPYEHYDSCAMNEPRLLAKLTDFDMTLELYQENMKNTLRLRKEDYLEEYLASNNSFKVNPGSVDQFKAGSLVGYRISSGCEGCGIHEYFFTLGPKTTLVVSRPYSVFNPMMAKAKHEKYLSLPGIITPAAEEKLFRKILATFQYHK